MYHLSFIDSKQQYHLTFKKLKHAYQFFNKLEKNDNIIASTLTMGPVHLDSFQKRHTGGNEND